MTGIQCGAGPRITDIPFLHFRRPKLPNRERDVTIARKTDIFLEVSFRRLASAGRFGGPADDESGFVITNAEDINDRSQIVAQGYEPNAPTAQPAFLLNPTRSAR